MGHHQKNNRNNKNFTSEQIINILKGYKELKRKFLQLEFEINNPHPFVTDEDVIYSMAFLKTNDRYIKSGQVSYKTSKIAISYFKKTGDLNIKHKQELVNELKGVKFETERLEYCIGILDNKYSNVLRSLYIDGLTFNETSEKLNTPSQQFRDFVR